eukprot:4892307-Pyramimonas_sp.AAC.1
MRRRRRCSDTYGTRALAPRPSDKQRTFTATIASLGDSQELPNTIPPVSSTAFDVLWGGCEGVPISSRSSHPLH